MHVSKLIAALLLAAVLATPSKSAPGSKVESPKRQAAVAFQRFVQATRQAERFEEVLPHLCRKDAAFYAFAKKRLESSVSTDPYNRALRTYQKIANEATKCVGVDIDGKTARVQVESLIDGKTYLSIATMTLERNGWKLSDFTTDKSAEAR